MKYVKYTTLSVLMLLSVTFGISCFSSCSDNLASEHYYTFKGEMMSDYLKNRNQYSAFSEIVAKANFMDLLSAYGEYTCFVPTNQAITKYLQQKGYSSVAELSFESCDTIVRTHLVKRMYSTSEMDDGALSTENMLQRFLQISHGLDSDSNAVVILNKKANVIASLKDDSVENGIIQPVDAVIEPSNQMLPDLMEENPKIKLFNEALHSTGLKDSMYKYMDTSWDPTLYPRYDYVSHVNVEFANVPQRRMYGYTAFVVPDSIFKVKYNITTLEDLYKKACELYDPVFPEDAGKDYHAFTPQALKDRRNPLNRFIAYNLLDRTAYYNKMTTNSTIRTTLVDPTEWFQTLCPHAMIKVQKVTVLRTLGNAKRNELYINRCWDGASKEITGSHVLPDIEEQYVQEAVNGIYYYVDNIFAYDKRTQDIVFNTRIRVEMATLFPELMTNGVRGNGDNTNNSSDEKYGRNYYFPKGYLANMTVNGGYFIYRRPRNFYDSYQGDEFNTIGDTYDVTFRLPPVPEGTYEVRLGFACEPTRGIAQVYFDNLPQGIPFDMRRFTDHATIGWKNPTGLTQEEDKENKKALKNQGWYRGPKSVSRFTSAGIPDGASSSIIIFYNQAGTVRKVLCTVPIKGDEYHTIRVRSVYSEGQAEFMMDYIEMVPKSIYGIDGEGQSEDDY